MKAKGRQKTPQKESQAESQKASKIIAELRRELAEREQDLLTYRSELESANRRLEDLMTVLNEELRLLNRLQSALVPTELPHISGFELSSKFISGSQKGGDYFDIFEHEDKFRFGVILSHCSGHVASSLFLSVVLKLTGQMEARRFRHSDEIMAQLTEDLGRQFSENDYAHVFYAIIDRRTFEMEFTACGSSILLHFQHQSQKLTRLERSNDPLSLKSDGKFQRHTLNLAPNDRLFLCSPGCVRATNPNGEVFGEERLYRCILQTARGNVHDARNEIFYQLQKFQKIQEPQLDQTVLVLEVKERVIRLTRN